METLAQDWSPLDREMQHSCALRCEDFSGGDGDSSIGKKWRETSGLVRTQNVSKSTDGGQGVDGGLQILWKRRWLCGIHVCRILLDDTVEVHQLPRGSKRTRRAGGMFFTDAFEWRRMVVVAPSGFDWRRMVVVASSGVDWRRRVDTSGTKGD